MSSNKELFANILVNGAKLLSNLANNIEGKVIEDDPLYFADRETNATMGAFSIPEIAAAAIKPYSPVDILAAAEEALRTGRIDFAGETGIKAVLGTKEVIAEDKNLDEEVVFVLNSDLTLNKLNARVLIAINSNIDVNVLDVDKHILFIGSKLSVGSMNIANGFVAADKLYFRKCNVHNVQFCTLGEVIIDDVLIKPVSYHHQRVNELLTSLVAQIIKSADAAYDDFDPKPIEGLKVRPYGLLPEINLNRNETCDTCAGSNHCQHEDPKRTEILRNLREPLLMVSKDFGSLDKALKLVPEELKNAFMGIVGSFTDAAGHKVVSANSPFLGNPVISGLIKDIVGTDVDSSTVTEPKEDWIPTKPAPTIVPLTLKEWELVDKLPNRILDSILSQSIAGTMIGSSKKEKIAQLKVLSTVDLTVADRIRFEITEVNIESPSSAAAATNTDAADDGSGTIQQPADEATPDQA